jgi:nucleotide-binding universal stress UspA family protein
VLFCFDGSDGSSAALRAAAPLLAQPVDAVVLTVWQAASTTLALAGAFAPGVLSDTQEMDEQEAQAAAAIAERGASWGREHGFNVTAMARETPDAVAPAILQVADELDCRLIVCGQRGRGPLRSALLGSVSHALASQARRPVLVVPEHEH